LELPNVGRPARSSGGRRAGRAPGRGRAGGGSAWRRSPHRPPFVVGRSQELVRTGRVSLVRGQRPRLPADPPVTVVASPRNSFSVRRRFQGSLAPVISCSRRALSVCWTALSSHFRNWSGGPSRC